VPTIPISKDEKSGMNDLEVVTWVTHSTASFLASEGLALQPFFCAR
jgi:hypothetical protein